MVIRIKKDNTLFYLLFLIAVFIVISITKSGTKSKDKPNDPGVKDSPQAPEKTETNDDKKRTIATARHMSTMPRRSHQTRAAMSMAITKGGWQAR